MSVYSCDICSFYTDRKNKLNTHLGTQKHKENSEKKETNITQLSRGQKNAHHRTYKQKTIVNVSPPEPPKTTQPVNTQAPEQSSPTIFTLLEIRNNQVVSTKQVDISNSVVKFM